jgi:hypothetical protein
MSDWKLIISGRNKRETNRRPSQGVKKKNWVNLRKEKYINKKKKCGHAKKN